MNPRERIEAVWGRQTPTHVPWSPMLGDGYLRSQARYWKRLTQEQQDMVKRSYRYPSLRPLPTALDFLKTIEWEMIRDVGGDVIASVQTVEAIDEEVKIETRPVGEEQTAFLFRTKWGDLREVVAGSASAETVYRTRFAVSERREYEIMARMIEHRRYAPCYESYEETQRALGDQGTCMVQGPDQPLVSLFRVRDPAELIFDLVDEPDRMQTLLDLLHQRALEGYQLIAKGPGQAVMTGMAFITTQLISPRQFERYVLPYLREYARVLHEANKILICHMCGHIGHLLPMLREARIDGIDSLTNPPVGDTELETFWGFLGDQAILISGIDATLLIQGTPDQIRAHARDVLQRTHGRHLILSSADEVPFGTPIENLLAIAEVVGETDLAI